MSRAEESREMTGRSSSPRDSTCVLCHPSLEIPSFEQRGGRRAAAFLCPTCSEEQQSRIRKVAESVWHEVHRSGDQIGLYADNVPAADRSGVQNRQLVGWYIDNRFLFEALSLGARRKVLRLRQEFIGQREPLVAQNLSLDTARQLAARYASAEMYFVEGSGPLVMLDFAIDDDWPTQFADEVWMVLRDVAEGGIDLRDLDGEIATRLSDVMPRGPGFWACLRFADQFRLGPGHLYRHVLFDEPVVELPELRYQDLLNKRPRFFGLNLGRQLRPRNWPEGTRYGTAPLIRLWASYCMEAAAGLGSRDSMRRWNSWGFPGLQWDVPDKGLRTPHIFDSTTRRDEQSYSRQKAQLRQRLQAHAQIP